MTSLTLERDPFPSLPHALRGKTFYASYLAALGVFEPFTANYFALSGLAPSMVGVLAAAVPLSNIVAAPPLSFIADAYGVRVKMIGTSLLLTGVCVGALAFSPTSAALCGWFVAYTFMRSPAAPVSDSVLVRMSGRHGMNFGVLRAYGSLGYAGAAIVSGSLWSIIGYRWMPVVSMALFLIAAGVGSALPEGEAERRPSRGSRGALLGDPQFRAILLGSGLIGGAIVATFIFGGLFMEELGGGPFWIGLMFGLEALFEVPMMQFAGFFLQRFGELPVFLFAGILALCALLGHVGASSPLGLVCAAIVGGMSFGLLFVSGIKMVDRRVPLELSSTAQGLLNASLFGVASLVASAGGGIVYEKCGPTVLWLCGALSVVIGMLVVLRAWSGGENARSVTHPS
jgi:MFS transporter, PPP family, 3-phenylpropionic acid transporter